MTENTARHTTDAAFEVANGYLVKAEMTAMEDRRGYVKFNNHWWLKVRIDDGFVYESSAGYAYADRDEVLVDLMGALGKPHAGTCLSCKRIRPMRDHHAAICEPCSEDLKAQMATPSTDVVADTWGRLYRAERRGDI